MQQQQQTPFNNFEQQQSIFNQLNNSLNHNNSNTFSDKKKQELIERQKSYFIQANPRHQNRYDEYGNFKGHEEEEKQTAGSMEEDNEEGSEMSNQRTNMSRDFVGTVESMNKKQEQSDVNILKKMTNQWPFGYTECCSSVFKLSYGIVQSHSAEKYQSLLKLLFISKLSYNIAVDDNMQTLWSQANQDFYKTYSPHVNFVDPKNTLKDSPDHLDCLVSFMTQFIFRNNPTFRNSLIQNASKVIDLNKQQMLIEQQTNPQINNNQNNFNFNSSSSSISSIFAVPTKAPTKKKVVFKKNK